MFKFAKLFLALSLVAATSAYADGCQCTNCSCTEESNCGCLSGNECKCGPDSSCSTAGGECTGGSCKVKRK